MRWTEKLYAITSAVPRLAVPRPTVGGAEHKGQMFLLLLLSRFVGVRDVLGCYLECTTFSRRKLSNHPLVGGLLLLVWMRGLTQP
jgi:hypothetical protein